jgi:ATP-dependent Lon protease
VGGIKEKVLAARRAGAKRVLVPEANRKELADLPKTVHKDMEFHLVESMDSVLGLVLATEGKAARPAGAAG